jgi:L-iditol 2-dehydrogenase
MTAPSMRAWWREASRLHYGERPIPALAASDEVRVRVEIAGLCRTDIAVARGALPCAEPCVLGHEIAGVVEDVGPGVLTLVRGTRVACLPQVDGQRLGIDRDGGFAGFLAVPERALVRVPDGLDARRAAFVEPVAACLAVTRAPLHGSVRVFGAGRIAELTRRILAARGFRDAPGPLDVAIETGGTDATLAEALRAVRPGGAVVLKSRPPRPLALDVTDAVMREIRLYGVGWAPFDEAFELLASGLEVEDLLGPIHPLADLERHFDAPESAKVFFAPE